MTNESILAALREIEAEEKVSIIYACEAGSRAWNFASQDSDYDVRFIYIRPESFYLSINVESARDVIERPISDKLDISGWDFRKALKLFKKTNPPLLEWLTSPIIYAEKGQGVNEMRKLMDTFYSPTAAAYHYLHMARGNYREYLQKDVVWLKKYLYVIRPLLAIRWIMEFKSVIPVEFSALMAATLEDGSAKIAIQKLLSDKKAGLEMGMAPAVPEIGEFIKSELEKLENSQFSLDKKPLPDIGLLNELFYKIVKDGR
jgi:predicted nucleotidyltransferase